MHGLLEPSIQQAKGPTIRPVRIRVKPAGRAFSAGEIGQLDTDLTDAKNLTPGDPDSGLYRIGLSNLQGTRFGAAHAVVEKDLAIGQEGWAVARGVVTIAAEDIGTLGDLTGAAVVIAVAANDDLHARRIRGIVVSTTADHALVLWNGIGGFGYVWDPAESGGSSGTSSGAPSGGASSGASSGAPSGPSSGAVDPPGFNINAKQVEQAVSLGPTA